VSFLLNTHPLEKRAARRVRGRKPPEVTAQVAGDLTLRLVDITETDPVPKKGEERPAQPTARVPHRAEETRTRSEGGEAAAAAEEMGFLFRFGLAQLRRDLRPTGEKRLPTIKRLGGYFAGVVDPEKASDAALFARRERRFRRRNERGAGEDRGKRVIEFGGESVTELCGHGGSNVLENPVMIRLIPPVMAQ
jgi:hypothetical protein